MGYASYIEDINDRRFEGLAAQQWLQRKYSKPSLHATVKAQPPAPRVTVELRPLAPPIIIVPPPAPTLVISDAERCRQIRDVHVLCLAELRPKARPEYHMRA